MNFDYINPRTTISLFIRWSFPFFVVSAIGPRFIKYYIDIIYVHVLISFVFFIPSILIPEFEPFLLNNLAVYFEQVSDVLIYDYNSNILVYTIKTSGGGFDVMRNSGPFWEAGGFAGYTLIALMFNILIYKKVWNVRNIVFLIGIGSTISTAGFIATSFFLLLYYSVQSIRRPIFVFISGAIIIGSIFLYSRIEIINYKIHSTFEEIDETDLQSADRSRIISAKLDLQDIRENFLVGKGRHTSTRFETDEITRMEHRNNGITDLFVKYGVFFGLFYFITIMVSLRRICIYTFEKPVYGIILFITIAIIGFAETYFQQSFFIAIFYLRELFPKTINL
ncbi:hypothetical protein ACFLTA_09515 [Bacteroidota bacterium]